MTRIEPDETRAQRAALSDARGELACALDELAACARNAARTARTKRGVPDLDAVYAAERAVRRAEEGVDFAALDVATAGGADA